jgi:hypothetical protein
VKIFGFLKKGDMESSKESIIKKAQALNIVKAVLGDLYTEHKKQLLGELRNLDVTEAFGTLNELLQTGLLNFS